MTEAAERHSRAAGQAFHKFSDGGDHAITAVDT